MKPTLDDAIGAMERLEALHHLDDSYNYSVVYAFLRTLKFRATPTQLASDREAFIIEGACNNGFLLIDDDADLLLCSCNELVEFVEKCLANPGKKTFWQRLISYITNR